MVGSREDSSGKPPRRNEALLSFRHHLADRWAPQNVPILVVGDSMLDVYVFGSVERVSPEAPVPVMKQHQTRESASGAANVAVNIMGLGGTCHLVSCCGADSEGERLAALLGEAGLTFDLIPTDSRSTTVKTRFAVGQHQLLKLDREDASSIPARCEDATLAAIAGRIDACRLLVLSDYRKGMLTDGVLGEAIAMARARNIPVVVDPKRRDLSVYRFFEAQPGQGRGGDQSGGEDRRRYRTRGTGCVRAGKYGLGGYARPCHVGACRLVAAQSR
jgi:bifunctional ADP-heptose synthase (sugar kinase/adenylyltransferase)